ncbi:hypothetical protein LTR47_009447 [Exophiala xenobiotica]|nr:hypothetical protein LTR47_009447 [Exophiala xenobiotica]KAK5287765.1 hypothetical protein LTR14_008996 [Exophiala xenobiotica]KAK5318628.1 hypothetical protein LTR93_008023 [Exophiala xenobiotica]KAK5348852.1 hypothetical protein LTR61_007433 [Exophiala xenobiotica]KAK5362432.1 hypothetical protein LTS13_009550 [Exophiala xenobiotica]
MSTEPKLRLALLIPRKKGMTEEEFHHHWANIHGPLIKYGVKRYRQFHRVEHKREAIGRAPHYDGIAEFIFDKFEDIEAAYKDPFYFEKVLPDERAFIDFDNIVFSIGKDLTVIDGGKIVLPKETGY